MTLFRRIRASVYDAAIVGLTASWYAAVLDRLAQGSRVLDVGIGTGSALLVQAERIAERDLHVTGIDIDPAYIERCRQSVRRAGLEDRIEVRLESVVDHRGGPYDAVYFSASFMLLPDPPAVLRHVVSLLGPGGRIYFTQTFEHRRSRLVEVAKPLLRLITTIDFGRVTYEADFRRAVAAGGVELESLEPLDRGRSRSSVLAVAKPERARGQGDRSDSKDPRSPSFAQA